VMNTPSVEVKIFRETDVSGNPEEPQPSEQHIAEGILESISGSDHNDGDGHNNFYDPPAPVSGHERQIGRNSIPDASSRRQSDGEEEADDSSYSPSSEDEDSDDSVDGTAMFNVERGKSNISETGKCESNISETGKCESNISETGKCESNISKTGKCETGFVASTFKNKNISETGKCETGFVASTFDALRIQNQRNNCQKRSKKI